MLTAKDVNDDDYRKVIEAAEGFTESSERWREIFSWLKSRCLRGVRMFTGDQVHRHGQLDIAEVLPEPVYQRRNASFYLNLPAKAFQVKAGTRRRQAQGRARHGVAGDCRAETLKVPMSSRRPDSGIRQDGQGRLRGDTGLHKAPREHR